MNLMYRDKIVIEIKLREKNNVIKKTIILKEISKILFLKKFSQFAFEALPSFSLF